MKKVNFFQTIHLKFVLIYVLLILIGMQIIGVYFVRQLESQLIENFKTSLNQRVNLLTYNLAQEAGKQKENGLEMLDVDIRSILRDFTSDDISEVRIINSKRRISYTTNPNNQNLIGKRTGEMLINRAFVAGTMAEQVMLDPYTNNRVRVSATPIKVNKDEVVGVVYVVASMEKIFDQMSAINKIFATGTGIALVITAILGIFLARTITRPISDMRRQALEMSKGNFSRKVRIYGYDEIGQLALTFNNLTKKLQEAQATTDGERRKLMSVLTHMTDGVIATDRKGRIILINDAALDMLNVSRETVLSEAIISVLGIDESYSFDTLIEEQDSFILDFSTRDKTYILRASFSVIKKETGFINGLITVLHDITEQEKIDEERREFVANVSHELRTPLTTMRSYLEALADGAWQDGNIAPHFIEVAQTETERMIRLVTDLLQLSRLDSREYKLNKNFIHFVPFFQKIIDRFEMTKADHITFIRALPNETLLVEIDTDKITQVLDNVISNALKYSPEGGRITFRVKQLSDRIEISIKDQGVGIPKKDLAKIFERFYRVDKARSRKLGGTGLGLAIAKEVITAHGGEIWAQSEMNKGTTIKFTLPLDGEQEDEWS